jgi:hypothetical protein
VQGILVSLAFGATLLILGVGLMLSHAASWRRQKLDPSLDETTREHYHARFRRRMLTSGIIAVLGCLIPLEGFIPAHRPVLFTIYCGMLLIFALWIFLLGIGDLMVTRAHTQAALSRIRGEQLALQKQLAELKGRRSNGHLDSD